MARTMRGFTARHTGMLTVRPVPAPEGVFSNPVNASSDNERLLVWKPTGDAVSDPLAPIGVPVTYTQYGYPPVTLVRRSVGSDIISTADGHTQARVQLIAAGAVEYDGGLTTIESTTGVMDRWAAAPKPRATTIECRTRTLEDFRTLRAMCEEARYLIVAHDQDACTIPGCTVEPIRVVAVSKAKAEQTESRLRGTADWTLTVTERPKSALHGRREDTGVPCVTWGEWLQFEADWAAGKVPGTGLSYWWGAPGGSDDTIIGSEAAGVTPDGRPVRWAQGRNIHAALGKHGFRRAAGGHTMTGTVWVRGRNGGGLDVGSVHLQLVVADGATDAADRNFSAGVMTRDKAPDPAGWYKLVASGIPVPTARPYATPAIVNEKEGPIEFGGLSMYDDQQNAGKSLATRTYDDVCRLLAGMPEDA